VIDMPRATSLPHVASRLLLLGLAVVLAGCGRFATGGSPTPPDSNFQALVASVPDPEGNATTVRYDSATRKALVTAAPGNTSAARFTGNGRISYLATDSIQSQDVLGGGQRIEAASPPLLISGYAWSSRGALAYLAQASDAGAGRGGELVIQRPGQPKVTVPMTARSGIPAGDPPQLQFSPDGSLLLVVDGLRGGTAQATLQVRQLDGRLVFGPIQSARPAASPSDATWGRDGRLYYRDARGVNVTDLRAGTTRTILPGVRWYRPSTSPDGRTIVFELRDARGVPRFELLDTATDTVVAGFERDAATLARFVSPSEIWFHPVAAGEVRGELVSLDTLRLSEHPTGLSGYLTDVRGR
jgi:hypothetical protein